MVVKPKTILSFVQWGISVLAIPALLWAWTLSTKVEVQAERINNLQVQVEKSDKHGEQLAAINATLTHLQRSLDDVKDLLRD